MRPTRQVTTRWVALAAAAVAWGAVWVHEAMSQSPAAGSTSSPQAVRRVSSQVATSQAAGQGQASLEQERIGGREKGGARGGWMDWLQPLAALAVVVVLIFVLRAVLRRLGGRARMAGAGQCVEVLGRQHLSPRCEVVVVRFGKRVLLVGLGAGGPVTLCEVSDAQEAAAVLAELSGGGGPSGGPVREVADRIRSRLSSGPKVEG